MASISKDPNGNRTIQFTAADNKRRSIRLGKMDAKAAEKVKLRIERLNTAMISNEPADEETARWVEGLDSKLSKKLAGAGLITDRDKPALGAFLDDYLAKRIDVTAGTREVWERAANNLKAHFGKDCDLRTIDEGRAEDFRLYLVGERLASTTIHKRLEHCRMFFRSAVKRKVVLVNPFAEVTTKAVMKPGRERYVTREETDRLLKVCNPEWAAIVSLARYGGLRCPSEVLSLRWQDINWESSRILVTSPKTARSGKPNRVIPLFPELREPLQQLLDTAPDGADYILPAMRAKALTAKGWRNINLRTQFERLVKRAALVPWSRLFNSLRASRETELAKSYPVHVVTAWMGNTPKIAMKHYLMTTDTDFEHAVGALHIPVQQPAATECSDE